MSTPRIPSNDIKDEIYALEQKLYDVLTSELKAALPDELTEAANKHYTEIAKIEQKLYDIALDTIEDIGELRLLQGKVENLLSQNKAWNEIIHTSCKSYPYDNRAKLGNKEELTEYFKNVRASIGKMPDMIEKNIIGTKLDDLTTRLRKPNLAPEELKKIKEEANEIHYNYGLLFHKVDVANLNAAKAKAEEYITLCNQLLENPENRENPEKKRIITNCVGVLSHSLKHNSNNCNTDAEAIKFNIDNFFNSTEMNSIKSGNPRKSKSNEETELRVNINSQLDNLEAEWARVIGKGKKSPAHITHQRNALNATKAYLNNDIDVKQLGERLGRNSGYDKPPSIFARSETKRLIQSACKLKGEDFPDPKAKKKSGISAMISNRRHGPKK